jgi:hypothetical protein
MLLNNYVTVSKYSAILEQLHEKLQLLHQLNCKADIIEGRKTLK